MNAAETIGCAIVLQGEKFAIASRTRRERWIFPAREGGCPSRFVYKAGSGLAGAKDPTNGGRSSDT
jgi:hypothetical protein